MSNESRPKAAHENPARSTDSLAAATDKSAAHRPSTGRRTWARALIDRATGPIPSYGSTEFLMADDATKLGSMAVAAEAWASDSENLEDDLRRETEAFRLGFKAAEDQEYQQAAAAHRERLSKQYGVSTSFAERRRRQLEAVNPREGDFTGGGPVTWDRGPA